MKDCAHLFRTKQHRERRARETEARFFYSDLQRNGPPGDGGRGGEWGKLGHDDAFWKRGGWGGSERGTTSPILMSLTDEIGLNYIATELLDDRPIGGYNM